MAEEEQNNSKMAGDGLKKGNHSTIVLMIRYKICTYLCMSHDKGSQYLYILFCTS